MTLYSKMILACLILAKARRFAKISSRHYYQVRATNSHGSSQTMIFRRDHTDGP